MRIEPATLFATPENMDQIMEIVEALPDGNCKATAMTAIMMTWNYACKCTNEEEDDE